MMSWKGLEEKLCGQKEIDVKKLRKETSYSGFGDSDLTIKLFWKVLEKFTKQQLSDYIRFVYGRAKLRETEYSEHSITKNVSLTGLPISHTCFFELELQEYTSESKLRENLLYAVSNCKDIAGESGGFSWSYESSQSGSAEELPQMTE